MDLLYVHAYKAVVVLVTPSCPALWDPMDYRPPGSSVHGIFQARILDWVAIPFSRESSWPRDWTWVSYIESKFFNIWARGKIYMCICVYVCCVCMCVCVILHTYFLKVEMLYQNVYAFILSNVGQALIFLVTTFYI